MSEILAVHGIRSETGRGYWLILDCGHWCKWTGEKLKVGAEFECPRDKPIKVVFPSAPSEKEK